MSVHHHFTLYLYHQLKSFYSPCVFQNLFYDRLSALKSFITFEFLMFPFYFYNKFSQSKSQKIWFDQKSSIFIQTNKLNFLYYFPKLEINYFIIKWLRISPTSSLFNHQIRFDLSKFFQIKFDL